MLQRVLSLASFLSLLVIVAACGGGQPTPAPQSGEAIAVDTRFHGAATASLEERIYLADVIVRATLRSVESDGYRFNAVEYLKGTGPKTFTVQASTAERNARWDGREAVLFQATGGQSSSPARSTATGTASLTFVDTTSFGEYVDGNYGTAYAGDLQTGDTIDRRNPVWVPASATSGTSRGSRSSESGSDGSSAASYITEARSPGGDANPTVSLADLRSKIAWIGGSAGIDGYANCIKYGLSHIRWVRDHEAYHRKPYSNRTPLKKEIASGAGSGTMLHSSTMSDNYGLANRPGYDRYWLEGDDASLFASTTVDPDRNPGDGWVNNLETARPLPAGNYRFDDRVQRHEFKPCNFISPLNWVPWEITVTAPEGTAHEALFDPARLTTGDGFDATGGTLEPAGFSIGGTTTAITGLKWHDGSVLMSLAPYVSLADHHLDFIALDGTLAHTVAVGDATRDGDTLSWPVDASPWPAGDQIMLRVYRKVASTCTVSEDGMKPGACYEKPAFRSSSYAFTLAEDAKVSRNVGAVSATVSGGGRPSYSIAGDGADHFTITDRGAIRTAAQLDHETMPSYSLEVVASSGRWGRSTASVTVTVTDVDPVGRYSWD